MAFFICFFYLLFILSIFIFLSFVLSFSFKESLETKCSPFECGFLGLSSLKEFFSVPFFLVSLMFLLFDVEILLLCLYPLVLNSLLFGFLNFFVILMVFFSTLYEWAKGILSWI